MQNSLAPKRAAFLFSLGMCIFPLLSHAAGSDAHEPISIEADRATYDEKKGETLYEGSVHAVQGTLVMDANDMTVYQQGKSNHIIAHGNPVRLRQKPDRDGEEMHGTGQRAEYYPDTGVLILFERAVVWQGGDSTESDRIEYDSKRNLVKAGDPGSGKSRVHVKLLPKSTGTGP